MLVMRLGMLEACLDRQHTDLPHKWRSVMNGASMVSYIIIFTLGYLLGGMTALIVFSLAVAARRGDNSHISAGVPAEESVAAWRK